VIKKITSLFFLIALALTSCTSSTGVRLKVPLNSENLHKTVYIDNSFSEPEENILINSLKEWECSTNYLITFNIKLHFIATDYIPPDEIHALLILKTNRDNPEIIATDKKLREISKTDDPNHDPNIKLYTAGLYIPGEIPTILMVMDRVNLRLMEAVALHEIGHSLEIHHIKTKDAVMFINRAEGAKHITQNDLEAFCKLYGCDEEELHACQ
jgi:hypothetical protein